MKISYKWTLANSLSTSLLFSNEFTCNFKSTDNSGSSIKGPTAIQNVGFSVEDYDPGHFILTIYIPDTSDIEFTTGYNNDLNLSFKTYSDSASNQSYSSLDIDVLYESDADASYSTISMVIPYPDRDASKFYIGTSNKFGVIRSHSHNFNKYLSNIDKLSYQIDNRANLSNKINDLGLLVNDINYSIGNDEPEISYDIIRME